MHGSCALCGRCKGKCKSVADHGSELHMRTKCSLNEEVISHNCLETVLCILRYKILYIEELGTYGLSKQFYITNAIPTPRGANSMKHVPNARNMDRAVCRFVEALSNSRSSGTVVCLLHQYLVLRSKLPMTNDRIKQQRKDPRL